MVVQPLPCPGPSSWTPAPQTAKDTFRCRLQRREALWGQGAAWGTTHQPGVHPKL